ncbi:MAG: hypothetical protein M0Z99_00760 [Betaproteobacteria bacterium]|nr:hypothetical protein [Betaproteobacteria bacterium]
MNTITEPVEQPTYLVDSRANLIIEAGSVKLQLAPADALELIKFVERTGYQAHANTLTKGAVQ